MALKSLSVLDLAPLAADPSTTGFVGGEVYWSTSLSAVRVWNGSVWASLGSSAPTIPDSYQRIMLMMGA